MMKRTYTDRNYEATSVTTSGSSTTSSDTDNDASTPSGDATTALSDALGTSTRACGRKRSADSVLTSGRYAPAESKRRVIDRVLNGLQEGTKSLIGTVEKMEEKQLEMEEKKMDRFHQIISNLTQQFIDQGHGESRVDAGRLKKVERKVDELKGAIDKIERTMKDMKGATDKILSILQSE